MAGCMGILRGGRAAVFAGGVLVLLLAAACSSIEEGQGDGNAPTAEPTAQPTETASTTTSAPAPGGNDDGLSTAELVAMAQSSVVRVSIASGVGSGFVIDPEGYIVTNHHVIENSLQSVDVMLSDGSVHGAELVGTDPASDIAVLHIDAGRELPALQLADLRDVAVGADVVAIGYALDLTQGSGPPSVTRGIVSAKNRVIQPRGILGAVQTDTAINHGNSGGPLLNYAGRVVGVNTALAPDQETGGVAQNIGFAVGADTVNAVYEEIREKGSVDRGFLGISNFSSIRPAEAEALGIPRETAGILLSDGGVAPGSPADEAGLQGRDVIIRVGEHDVADESDLAVAMIIHNPGETVDLTIYRSGAEQAVPVTLGTP